MKRFNNQANEIAANYRFPLSKEKALGVSRGYRWREADPKEYAKRSYVLPDDSKVVEEEICRLSFHGKIWFTKSKKSYLLLFVYNHSIGRFVRVFVAKFVVTSISIAVTGFIVHAGIHVHRFYGAHMLC